MYLQHCVESSGTRVMLFWGEDWPFLIFCYMEARGKPLREKDDNKYRVYQEGIREPLREKDDNKYRV